MSEHSEVENADSVIDAWAIFSLILIAVGTAIFWVSGQSGSGPTRISGRPFATGALYCARCFSGGAL